MDWAVLPQLLTWLPVYRGRQTATNRKELRAEKLQFAKWKGPKSSREMKSIIPGFTGQFANNGKREAEEKPRAKVTSWGPWKKAA